MKHLGDEEVGAGAGEVVDAKSNMEVDGALVCEGCENGEFCSTFEEARAANGSEDCGGGAAVCCCRSEGTGVVLCDIGRELVKEANAS